MTTKNSPVAALRVQARNIASLLKAAERGDKLPVQYAEKIAAARANGAFKVGIAMDDKIITVELPWATIQETSQAALAEYIVGLMREEEPDQ